MLFEDEAEIRFAVADEVRTDLQDAERCSRLAQETNGRIPGAMRTKRKRHPRSRQGRRLPGPFGNHVPCGALRAQVRRYGTRNNQPPHSMIDQNAIPRIGGMANRCCSWDDQPNTECCCSKTCQWALEQGTAQSQTRSSEQQQRASISIDPHSS